MQAGRGAIDSEVAMRTEQSTRPESGTAPTDRHAGENPRGDMGRRELLRVLRPEVMVAGALVCSAQANVASPVLGTEDRVALALMHFRTGFHCSQSVLAAYADELGIDQELALRLAAGLAGGSAVGGECGTLAAGYLILGLKHARLEPAFGDTSREGELFGRIRQLVAEFRQRNGSINCRELLGTDVCTQQGRSKALEAGLFEKHCRGYIRDAIEILDSLG